MSRILAIAAAALLVGLPSSGCANPDAPAAGIASRETQGGAGEPPAPAPPPPALERPAAAQRTAKSAVEQFAGLYTNWDYRSLAAAQRSLAAISVGAARLQARQAAASARTEQLVRGHVWNRGEILAVTRDRARADWWLVVTREQTGGSGEYESLPATYHVTLALAVGVGGGWAVSEWRPQS